MPSACLVCEIPLHRVRTDTIDNNADEDWWWIDAFYMAGPVLAHVANLENNEAYRTRLGAMFRWMKSTRGLFDPAAGLWYRDAAAKTEISQNGGKVFWSRGNGWVLAGLVRVLEQLPASHPDHAEYEAMFQTMYAARLPLQGTDGFWRASLTDPDHFPNPETSGTAFFAHGYGWGIRNGLLNTADQKPAAPSAPERQAWSAGTASQAAIRCNPAPGCRFPVGGDPRQRVARRGSRSRASGADVLPRRIMALSAVDGPRKPHLDRKCANFSVSALIPDDVAP